MAYMDVVEHTGTRLRYARLPSYRSWVVLIGLTAFGVYVAAASSDSSFLWRLVCALAGLGLGYICMDKWEECVLDKREGKVYLHEQTLADRFVFNYRKKSTVLFSFVEANVQHSCDAALTVVSELDAVIDVKVEKEVVRYAGTGYQVCVCVCV
jgi:hypothetical protein